ncbi:MAG: tRNA (uridine(34)/cytosine(34)/5-carboxymethylaminomethyluridine(34)-2'-O)-methyltransferase TrmL [Candidatus Binatia bacterium]|nr:tRNA (uridine(34)/cytosine(34)/5-carboxymethylaminomethyluridine(34)-2'-O)-methyltransferase TrmL [Candidatus Binatia bacterium]
MSDRPVLHVVLVAPEIPQNTGSIARLCAATYCRLHLIKPLGFSLEDRYLKRAGLDYWPYVDWQVHDSWAQFLSRYDGHNVYFFSARAEQPYWNARYRHGDVLVFGSETKGLPAELREQYRERFLLIPIDHPHVRSLNLSNAVSIVVYEALRQMRT